MNQNHRWFLWILFFLTFAGCPKLKSWQEPLQIVELPTAGLVAKSSFAINSEFFHSGGIRFDFFASVVKDLLLGFSFSGINIVGSGKLSDIDFQRFPGVFIKYRLIDERILFPAIAIGLSTQGFGKYSSSARRFETYSPGIFLIGSKSFKNSLGFFTVHLGMNYSLEPAVTNRALNYYIGLEQEYQDILAINLEYNATRDEIPGEYLKSKGLLNFMFQVYVYNNFTVGLIYKDLLLHFRDRPSSERKIFIQYIGNFK
ncbi:MAG: hypothetical protein ACUVQ1_09305 [Candidatus Kapaibacteriales bacterium]